jgi:zinc protease
MLDRKTAPPIVDAVHFKLNLKPYEKYVLHNGTPVYAINAGTEEMLLLEFIFYAGNWYESATSIAFATNSLLKNGTRTKTALEINELLEYYGVHLTTGCYNETAVISVYVLNKHLEKILPLLREIITESVFPEAELNIFRQNRKQKLAVDLKKCDIVANRKIDVCVFGPAHPYGKYNTVESYDALTPAQLQSHFQQFYQNGKSIFFVAGKVPGNMESLLNNYFGDLSINNELPEVLHPLVPAAEKKYRISNDPDSVQGAIRIAREFPNRHHPDFSKVQVLNNIFGGFFGSRLMSNIREDKGYTYGIHSYTANLIQCSSWMVSTEAGRDVCEATVKEVYKEMDLLREELVDDEELSLVRNYMIGSVLADLDGPFQILGRWKNILLNGLDERYFYDAMEITRSITAEELRELARKYLVPEDFYELIVI